MTAAWLSQIPWDQTQGTLWRGRLVGRAAGDPGGLGVPFAGPHGVLAEEQIVFLGRWVGPSVADGKNHENMRDHGIKTRGWIRLPKLEIQIEMGIQIDLGCKITKK